MSQQKSDFIITNYDNFKDASLFIKQYFEAEKKMKDILHLLKVVIGLLIPWKLRKTKMKSK